MNLIALSVAVFSVVYGVESAISEPTYLQPRDRGPHDISASKNGYEYLKQLASMTKTKPKLYASNLFGRRKRYAYKTKLSPILREFLEKKGGKGDLWRSDARQSKGLMSHLGRLADIAKKISNRRQSSLSKKNYDANKRAL